MKWGKLSEESTAKGGEHHKGTEQDQERLTQFFAARDLEREIKANRFFAPTTPEQHWHNVCELVRAGAYAKVREYVEKHGGKP